MWSPGLQTQGLGRARDLLLAPLAPGSPIPVLRSRCSSQQDRHSRGTEGRHGTSTAFLHQLLFQRLILHIYSRHTVAGRVQNQE